jgi:hypothetical protein
MDSRLTIGSGSRQKELGLVATEIVFLCETLRPLGDLRFALVLSLLTAKYAKDFSKSAKANCTQYAS